MRKERAVEIKLRNWFKEKTDFNNIQEIYFNSTNEVNAPIFRVVGIATEIPDLLLKCNLFGKKEYIAIEVKDASQGGQVTSSCKIFEKYLKNYINGETKYFINDEEVIITRFAVATQYSEIGKLYQSNDFIIENEDNKDNPFLNKVIPKLEYNRTRQFLRQNISFYAQYRKKNKIKKAPGLGIIVSDILTTFELKDLEVQEGMIGKPLFQGINFNNSTGRWQQCLINL